MYFDALTLAAVTDELEATVLGGRIQRVLLPSPLSVALEIYAAGRRRHLLLSAHPQLMRVQLGAAKLSRGVEQATPLLLLLRKYLVGGQITQIDQPELERVLVLSIVKGPHTRNTANSRDDGRPTTDEAASVVHRSPAVGEADAEAHDPPDEPLDDEPLDEPLRSELVIEAMERRANVILVGDDNIVLECLRHIPPRLSRRPILPHQPYELPPRQEKRDPRNATPEGLRALLGGAEPNLARALVSAYRGLAPLAAREVVFRCTGAADTALAPDLPWARLALELRGLWAGEWRPCLLRGAAGPEAFAPYWLSHLPGAEPAVSIGAAIEAYYRTHEQLGAHQQRRATIEGQLREARARLSAQRQGLATELARAAELDRLRWEGEMIYAFMHTLVPGQASLTVEDRTIALDPRQTPVENAQERFRAYDKAKGALAGVPELLRETEARLAGLDETLALLALAEGFEQIEGIAREATEQGYLRAPSGRRKPAGRRLPPLRVESSDGFSIYVGRSAGQNELVTFKIGAADDLWLHARGIPGAHVVIKSGGRAVPEQTLREAAELAAYYSQARGDSAVEVDTARRSQVGRIPGGPPGLVSYRAEGSLRATPRSPRI